MDFRGDSKAASTRISRRHVSHSVTHLPHTSDPLRTANLPAKASPSLSTLKRSSKVSITTRSIRLTAKRPSNLSAEWTSNSDSRPTDTHRDEYQQVAAASPELVLVRKLKKDRLERQRRTQQSAQLRREKSLLESEMSSKRLSELELERRAAKLQAFKKRQEDFTARRANRQLMRVVTEADMRKVKNARLRHVEMEENYKKRFESPMIERRQQILGKKKELRRPIDLEALESHAKSYDNLLQRRKLAQKVALEAKFAELRKMQEDLAFYKPRAATIIEQEIRQRKLAEFDRSETVKRKVIRKKRYGILVRELFPPKISPQKRAESEMKVRSLSEKKLRTPGKPLDFEWKPTLIRRKRSRSVQSLDSQSTARPVVDYLRQRRLKHEKDFADRVGCRSESHWEDIWSDSSLSSPERITEIHKVAQRLDSKAKHQEALLNRMGQNWEKSVEATEAVSKMYMESIRAKLALLNSIE